VAALRFNILSNYVGQLWMAVIGIAFLPLYIRILGMEAFGFVGLMLSFQSILQLFDFGIGGAANRELSRRAHDPSLSAGSRNFVRTSEIVIWTLPLVAALLIWACSGPIADHWLHLRAMKPDEGSRAIAIMGVAIALLWPSTFYANCLSGLEQQPTLNVLNAGFSTLRYAGVAPILLWVSPTIEAFLWWHAFVGAAQSLAMAEAVWRLLPNVKGERARFRMAELRGSRGFAGGLFGIGLLALSVTQLDRLVLTSMRPLVEMGQYTLALSVASGLGRMTQPMFNAIYPRFSRLVARNDMATLKELYHLSSQYLTVVISAVSAVLIVFAQDVLFLWTGDREVADKVALPMAILVSGYALNGLVNIPYALQLANGWTRPAMTLNAIALAVGIPYCLWAIAAFGTAGAAGMCVFANLVSLLVGVPWMHRHLLRSEMGRWFTQDILPPVLLSGVVATILAVLMPPLARTPRDLAMFILACVATLIASTVASHAARQLLAKWLQAFLPDAEN
jgi:O-antigen/teichoic acid export membrane protein